MPAVAEPGAGSWSDAYVSDTGDSIGTWAKQQAEAALERAAADLPGGAAVTVKVSVPRQRYRTVRTLPCAGGNPNGGADGSVNACDTVPLDCEGNQVRQWVWSAPIDDAGDETGPYVRVNEACGDPAAAAVVVVPAMTLEDFQLLPLEPAPLTVQPPDNIALINFPANVYVDPAVAELDTVLAGVPMRVRATPVEFSYDFGDGTVIGPTADTGGPVPNWIDDVPVDEVERHLQVAHSYTEDSEFAITVTTHYRGEYAVAGGPWLPIDGQASVAGEPYPVEIMTVTPRLVADTVE